MTIALTAFDQAINDDTRGGVRIVTRHGDPWISVPRMDPLPAPVRLEQLKAEVQRRWGTIDLLDVLKDSDFLCEFTDDFVSTASREVIDRDLLRRRLLLTLFALGTNMGIKAGVNATFDARDPRWWGTGTSCARDSKRFGSWESNLMTEWHNRYGRPGIMIYWHVERESLCATANSKTAPPPKSQQ
jgi:Tn3 transposase DDE domain